VYKYQDLDLQRQLPFNEQILSQDLELDTLFNAMSLGDNFIFNVVKQVILSSENDIDTILYRQDILKDCLKNSQVVREIYNLSLEFMTNERVNWFRFYIRRPSTILSSAIANMEVFVDLLKKLREIADEHNNKFESAGFTCLFTMLKKELSDEYFDVIQNYLNELKFDDGVLVSVKLGKGNEGNGYTLRRSRDTERHSLLKLFNKKPPVYFLHFSDEQDSKDSGELWEIRERGTNRVANVIAQSSDHIVSFFQILRAELAFYIGCLNLNEQLTQMREPVSFPLVMDCNEHKHSFKELYDACLALTMKQKIVGNDLYSDGKKLVIVTGANRGGKSTFLRSIGLSQLMMQCGMFVPAEAFTSSVCTGLFTHFKRDEDATLTSGKLEEELSRMSTIIDKVVSNSMVLFNESFSTTNSKESSEIARQISCALLEKNVTVFFVTHLYEFAHGIHESKLENSVFLLAERKTDGMRTFKLKEGAPLDTSHGQDLYFRIFETDN